MGFLGGKEWIRTPINSKHSSLEALKRHIRWVRWFETWVRKEWSRILDWNKTLLVRKVCRREQSLCDKQGRQRGWNDFSTSSYYSSQKNGQNQLWDKGESNDVPLEYYIYPSALVIISLPSSTFHCMFTPTSRAPGLTSVTYLRTSCVGGTKSKFNSAIATLRLSI